MIFDTPHLTFKGQRKEVRVYVDDDCKSKRAVETEKREKIYFLVETGAVWKLQDFLLLCNWNPVQSPQDMKSAR